MTKILFVCLGNQCRSPMAKYVLQDMIDELKLSNDLYVESAGTYEGITGRPVFIPAKRVLNDHGIDCNDHFARHVVQKDYDYYDYIVCMDHENLDAVKKKAGGDPLGKISLLMSFPESDGDDVADPMITNDYDQAYKDIHYGCRMLLWYLMEQDNR